MQFPFCSLMCTIWPLTPYSCASVSMAQLSFFRPPETLVTDAQLLTMCENSSFQFFFFC